MSTARPASLADYAALAATVLEPGTRAYFHGGAADGHTQRRNREAWDALELLPRVLRPLGGLRTEVALLGRQLPVPLLVAPMAYQRLAHPEAERGTALAASAQGCGFVLSTQSTTPMEAVAEAIRGDDGRGPLWFQLYWQADRGHTRELLRRAEASGYEAIVLTVDAPVSGVRDAERRAGFRLPHGLRAAHLAAGSAAGFESLMAAAPTWDDVVWLRRQTALPLLLKGILHPDDARQAVQCKADGLIVSNHGGRTLDTAPPTARMLPRIAQAVDGRVPVLVDGGIRRGTDVLKAMALGAAAVLVGRPVLDGLAVDGPAGAAHVLRLLRDELAMAMALCGVRELSRATPELLLSRDLGSQ